MPYQIFANMDNAVVVFVGCTKGNIPAKSLLLQVVTNHPNFPGSNGKSDFAGHSNRARRESTLIGEKRKLTEVPTDSR